MTVLWNKLNEPWPDLILLDWMLPGGSGIQFIKHLKRESMTRDIPVVMLTARGEERDRVRAALKPVRMSYITKPFSPKELVARIKAVMRRISPMAVEEVIEIRGKSVRPDISPGDGGRRSRWRWGRQNLNCCTFL